MPPAQRRRAVLDAAVDCFAADPAGTTMDQVAARAGMSKAAVYDQFGSKQDLFEAVVERETDLLTHTVVSEYEAARTRPPREQVRRRFASLLEYTRRRPAGAALLIRLANERGAGAGPRLDALRERMTDRLTHILRHDLDAAGRPSGLIADILAVLLLALARTTAVECVAHETWNADAVLDLVTDFTLGGLLNLSPEVIAAADTPRALPS